MIDSSDYKEPSCALCGGKEFYYPDPDAPKGVVPVNRIIDKVNGFFSKDDLDGAKKLLEYWKKEATELNDLRGLLSVENELIGVYRKTGDKENALNSVASALDLIKKTNPEGVSAATIMLNAATAFKAFGMADESIGLFEKAEKIYDEKLAPLDDLKAGLYNNRALAYSDLGMFEKAEADFLKAKSIMETKGAAGKPDLAITLVNLAHLYDDFKPENKNLVTDCLYSAYGYLTDEEVEKNAYFAYVLQKCAPSYEYFRYKIIAEQFKKTSEEIYERAGNSEELL